MEKNEGWLNITALLPYLADNIISWQLPIWSTLYLDENKLKVLLTTGQSLINPHQRWLPQITSLTRL